MGMISDIFVNAKTAVQKAGEKANEVCDVSKLKFSRKSIKADVYKNYTALGRKYYALAKKGELEDADFSAELDTINELHQMYEDITKEIEALSNKKRCKVCSASLDNDCDVCPECGNEM